MISITTVSISRGDTCIYDIETYFGGIACFVILLGFVYIRVNEGMVRWKQNIASSRKKRE
ncbi:MAG: hypothetical protein P857_647 [Candidatus Xenolissoclinum pacificiensis L6]|uniref:Uncharacterized protein n=1 Tax=Candidatus Xenolissoclinum pacificiensis L6 TaxID=1401685 RepID=W2UZ01_9RICK|nr:MAG: hypothetical protein P857_647 [Candidatus Xenolissoclinum pacificiensis L6]